MQECRPGGTNPHRQGIVAVALDDRRAGTACLPHGQHRLLHDGGLGRIERRRPERGNPPTGIGLDLNSRHHRHARQSRVIHVHRHPLVGAEQPKAGELHLPRQEHVPGSQRAQGGAVQKAEPVLLELRSRASPLPHGVAGEIIVPAQLVSMVAEDFRNPVTGQKALRIDSTDREHPLPRHQAGAKRLDPRIRRKEFVVAHDLDVPIVDPQQVERRQQGEDNDHVAGLQLAAAPQEHGSPGSPADQRHDQSAGGEPRNIGGKSVGPPVGFGGAEDRSPGRVEPGTGPPASARRPAEQPRPGPPGPPTWPGAPGGRPPRGRARPAVPPAR